MIENVVYQQIYQYFATTWPKEKTDRISDLNHLLGLRSSFCLFSDYRNGTTTLLRDLAGKVGGTYIDSMPLPDELDLEKLEQIIGSKNTPLLLDEGACFVRRCGDTTQAINYLLQLSEKRQVGLRLHLKDSSLKDDLQTRGFQIVEIGKISYEEFKAMVYTPFQGVDFNFPERFIQYAHSHYDRLFQSSFYVGEAFRLMIERPNDNISEVEVQRSVEQDNPRFFLKRKEKI